MQAAILLAVVGASHCFLLAVVSHLQSRVPRTSDKILTTILLIEGLRLSSLAAIVSGYGGLWMYVHTLRFATGPLIFFYTLFLIGRPALVSRRLFLHFLPLVGIAVLILFNQLGLLQITRQQMVAPVALVEGMMFIVYGYVARRAVLSYRRELMQTHSYLEHINLGWLRFVCFYVLCMGVVLVAGVFYLLLSPQMYSLDRAIVMSVLTTLIFCYVISLKGIQQSRLFERLLVEDSLNFNEVQQDLAPDKYQSSILSSEDVAQYYHQLVEVMEQHKLYLRPRLKLADLAQETGIHPQQVSQVINQSAQKRFYDFVNGYRVEEALRLLGEPQPESKNILDIAHKSGFNSAATFYKYFRKYTGKTPLDILRETESSGGVKSDE